MIRFGNCNCEVDRGNFSINDIPLNCPAVWKLIGSGNTVGVFQLEKSLGQDWAQKIRPDNIEELAALTALLRPGPLEAGMTKDYSDIKFGRKKISYLHKSLKPILEPTYGCLVYQEQAIRIATDIAGFSPETADELRKAIGKKKPELMAKLKDKFVVGAQEYGQIEKETAVKIFGWIEKCQRYSFNKSHAVSYGMIAYQTAWAKCHFPQEFFASYLTYSQYKGDPKDEIYKLVQDARLFGINVLPPDIRKGNVHFEITDGDQPGVSFGLSHIRGVGTSAIKKIVAASRETPGVGIGVTDAQLLKEGLQQIENSVSESESELQTKPSKLDNWAGFLSSVPDLHRNVGIALIKSGACDCYGIARNEMVRELEIVLGTTVLDEEGKKIEIKGLTAKEKVFFFDQLKDGAMTTRDILQQMSHPPNGKTKTIGQMLKPELITTAMGFLRQADVAFGKIVDGDNEFVFTTTEEKEAWLDNLKSRTKKGLGELITQNGYQDTVIRPPCNSDARRKIVANKAKMLENPLKDTNTASAIAEKHFLGIALSCSPADDADGSLATHTCLDVARSANNESIVVCAIVDGVRHTKTKKGRNPGQSMCFLTVSDATYSIDHAVVFPDAFGSLKAFCKEDVICLIYGQKKNGSFIVKDMQKLI
jgi:DNA polymerase III alpha subunit